MLYFVFSSVQWFDGVCRLFLGGDKKCKTVIEEIEEMKRAETAYLEALESGIADSKERFRRIERKGNVVVCFIFCYIVCFAQMTFVKENRGEGTEEGRDRVR